MNKIKLKNGGFVYIEPFNDYEDDERCQIYDENMNYLDFYYTNHDEFDEDCYYGIIDYLRNLDDIHEYLMTIFDRYDYGNSLKQVLENYLDTYAMDYQPEELENELDKLLLERSTTTEQEFCANHGINKIGNLYIIGDY